MRSCWSWLIRRLSLVWPGSIPVLSPRLTLLLSRWIGSSGRSCRCCRSAFAASIVGRGSRRRRSSSRATSCWLLLLHGLIRDTQLTLHRDGQRVTALACLSVLMMVAFRSGSKARSPARLSVRSIDHPRESHLDGAECRQRDELGSSDVLLPYLQHSLPTFSQF